MVRATSSILAVTGESSGEQHLAGVIRAFSRLFPQRQVEWFGSGGPQMRAAGAELMLDVASLAAIGPRAALSNLPTYISFYRSLIREVRSRRPALAVLVDFPEFNLRMARRLKREGVVVCYFIGPQIWAWRASRVESIRRYVDRMLVILPFEEDYYRQRGVEAHYVGHPLTRHLSAQQLGPSENGSKTVALMPGSRRGEIEAILPVLLDAAAHIRREVDCHFWLLRAPSIQSADLQRELDQWRTQSGVDLPIEIRSGQVPALLPQAHCAIIKSGTSTLEAMILGVPFVMVYRMSPLSYRLLKPWVRTQTYCLANLIAGRPIVPEFIQEAARGREVAKPLVDMLQDASRLEEMKQNLRFASETLGRKDAYIETARQVARLLDK